MSIKKSHDIGKIQVQTDNYLNNHICAYRNCSADSSVRIYFALGFSAVFCKQCAGILIQDGLARELPLEDIDNGLH